MQKHSVVFYEKNTKCIVRDRLQTGAAGLILKPTGGVIHESIRTHICIDCRNYQAIQASRGFEAEFIDITADTANLKEFLALRDHDPVFAPVREHGGIGIPLFVREDGRKTFDIDEALSWIGQPPVREEEIVEHRPCCDSCQ